jgi:hypothetical protein
MSAKTAGSFIGTPTAGQLFVVTPLLNLLLLLDRTTRVKGMGNTIAYDAGRRQKRRGRGQESESDTEEVVEFAGVACCSRHS